MNKFEAILFQKEFVGDVLFWWKEKKLFKQTFSNLSDSALISGSLTSIRMNDCRQTVAPLWGHSWCEVVIKTPMLL